MAPEFSEGPQVRTVSLRVTNAVRVTEDRGSFLGIDGVGVLYVFATFTLANLLCGQFLISCGLSLLIYLVLRLYLSGKPRNFLWYALLYPFRPKVYRHQCGRRRCGSIPTPCSD